MQDGDEETHVDEAQHHRGEAEPHAHGGDEDEDAHHQPTRENRSAGVEDRCHDGP